MAYIEGKSSSRWSILYRFPGRSLLNSRVLIAEDVVARIGTGSIPAGGLIVQFCIVLPHSVPGVQRLSPGETPGEDDLISRLCLAPRAKLVKVNEREASVGLPIELIVAREDADILCLIIEEL